MPRKKPAIIKSTPTNRPKALKRNELVLIDWKLVDELFKKDYNGKQVAEKYSISYTTLARKFEVKTNELLGDYIRKLPETVANQWNEANKNGKSTFDEIEQLMQAGCLGTELAAYFGVGEEFIKKVILAKNKVGIREMRRFHKEKGNAMLRAKQFGLAMKGDKQMLTILGKDRLSQIEKTETTVNIKARVLSPEEMREYLKGLNEEY